MTISTQTYVLVVAIIGLILVVLWACSDNMQKESGDNSTEQFHSDTSTPPFLYPTDIPQPAGPQGWGYRDPQATYQTLLWDQTRQPLLMPDFNPGVQTGYLDLSVPSAPVQKKQSPFEGTWARPPIPNVRQRPVAQLPYANWASTLQA